MLKEDPTSYPVFQGCEGGHLPFFSFLLEPRLMQKASLLEHGALCPGPRGLYVNLSSTALITVCLVS